MTSNEIRKKYLDFFKSKGHTIISGASLLPENDPSLLFTNSGMSPLVPYLLGEKHPSGKRLVNLQKCFRAEDIEEVGDSRHTTFFEMLGNWSFGDYFKKNQLNWWFEFLVDCLGLDPSRLYQTVYAGDKKIAKDAESIDILKKIYAKYKILANEGPETRGKGEDGPGVKIDFSNCRIFAYQDKNWWQRGDAINELGGPDSETFYDTGREHNPKFGQYCHLNCDCGRFIEIGNSVFMQYQKIKDGWRELERKNVDFGGGLERVAMFAQNKDNVFETDLFINVIKKIEELSEKKYNDDRKSFEIIADHLKAAAFIMGDDKGIAPSNVEQGYIVRRLIRRAIRYGRMLDIRFEKWTKKIAKIAIEDYKNIYPELKRNEKFIIENLDKEEAKFQKTLKNGLKELKKLSGSKKEINGQDAFNLYQTYGFPLEMTEEELGRVNKKVVQEEKFAKAIKKHQELSRTAAVGKFKGGLADASEQTTKLHTAAHLFLAASRQVLGNHIKQRGSNITAQRLRFDFSHNEKLSDKQKNEIENLVNKAIEKDLPISFEEISLKEAKEKGAVGVFESRYGEKVKIYSIGKGENRFSYEICGGPHLDRTGKMGRFIIKKEKSSGAGVRRIKAVLE